MLRKQLPARKRAPRGNTAKQGISKVIENLRQKIAFLRRAENALMLKIKKVLGEQKKELKVRLKELRNQLFELRDYVRKKEQFAT